MIKIFDNITPQMRELRETVFVAEMGVPLHEENCDDESQFFHLCIFDGDILVAYCRVKDMGDYLKIGRVVVCSKYRHKG
ncbi:MAG: hypothetical protein LBU60_04010, partial [Clostridiales bacterium]|nr:hypothetical protein [Clostridiales bacterium]